MKELCAEAAISACERSGQWPAAHRLGTADKIDAELHLRSQVWQQFLRAHAPEEPVSTGKQNRVFESFSYRGVPSSELRWYHTGRCSEAERWKTMR